MNIRMKGDVVKQLNDIYSISFKVKYKNELRQRIIEFYNSLFKGSFVELLEFSKEFCVVEKNEIRVLNENFVNKYKTELFNSFNPLWYSNRRRKETIVNEEEIGLETAKKMVADYIDFFETKTGGVIRNVKGLFYLAEDSNSCIYNKVSEELVFLPNEKERYLSISNIFEYDLKKVKKKNEKTNEYLKEIKRTLQKQKKRFETFSIRLYLKDKSLLRTKWYFEKNGIGDNSYNVFVNQEKEVYYLDENFKRIKKECQPSYFLEKGIFELKRKRDLIDYLIFRIDKEIE